MCGRRCFRWAQTGALLLIMVMRMRELMTMMRMRVEWSGAGGRGDRHGGNRVFFLLSCTFLSLFFSTPFFSILVFVKRGCLFYFDGSLRCCTVSSFSIPAAMRLRSSARTAHSTGCWRRWGVVGLIERFNGQKMMTHIATLRSVLI